MIFLKIAGNKAGGEFCVRFVNKKRLMVNTLVLLYQNF